MSKNNKRKYIRISTVLPIEFFILDAQGKKLTPWLQGFTHDIGRGGICLLMNDLWWGLSDRLKQKDIQLSLRINFPFNPKPMCLKAKVSWIKEQKLNDFNQYILGLEFVETQDKKVNNLFKYAVVKKSTPIAVSAIVAGLLIFSFSLFWYTGVLVRKNRKLVNDYVNILDKRLSLEEVLEKGVAQKESFEEKRLNLELAIKSLNDEVVFWQDKYDALVVADDSSKDSSEEALNFKKKVVLLELELARLNKQNDILKTKGKNSKTAVLKIQEVIKTLQKEGRKSSQKVIKGMYDWIKNRQDLKRGLVLSYEGDDSLERVCFTYDQALATFVFLVSGDSPRAGKVLDFYLNKINKGQDIYNAYFTQGDVFEYVLHSGPNAWLGLAALCYTKETGEKKYLPVAKKAANFLLAMMDGEGGVKGGPDASWYSTEHNLDVFAFFKLFYEITGEKKYINAAESVKKWISRYSYTDYGSPPIKRGKGDSTIATDTYAWSITAFGPKELLSLKMNPESILEFAVTHCEVGVKFKREEGEVKVRGFDFSKINNAPRGGVVSGEWTSQMILAFEIMADYFKDKDPKKSKEYLEKAFFYFNELQKMLITSPSRVGREDPCLPYASNAFVDTGHGWRTPKGNRTGSLASTAYFLLTYHGYNPLKGEFLDLSLKGNL
ncbi:MAG: PilZ domain-containing protein [Candidatus Omnitrophica bacterium]|nr:PilZ domain-containing protein [Candidatus Omnitrophota bacterium]